MPEVESLCGKFRDFLSEAADDLQISLFEFMESR
jgi:hypothetical protein